MTRVSIITPSLNQGRFIGETLQSVKDQDYPGIEHIVIDGGSTDGTIDTLRRYEGVYNLAWTSEPDGGQAHAINKGFRKAGGDVLAYLDSDDLYLPGTVSMVVGFLDAHRDVDCVYGDIVHIDESGGRLNTVKSIPFQFETLLYGGSLIAEPSFFFRRRVLEEAGYLDESLSYQMDYEFFLRAASRKMKFANIPAVLALFRLHPGSKTMAAKKVFFKDDVMIKSRYRRAPLPLGEKADRCWLGALKKAYRLKAFLIRAATRGQFMPFATRMAKAGIGGGRAWEVR